MFISDPRKAFPLMCPNLDITCSIFPNFTNKLTKYCLTIQCWLLYLCTESCYVSARHGNRLCLLDKLTYLVTCLLTNTFDGNTICTWKRKCYMRGFFIICKKSSFTLNSRLVWMKITNIGSICHERGEPNVSVIAPSVRYSYIAFYCGSVGWILS